MTDSLPFPHRILLVSQFSPSPPLNSSLAFEAVSLSEFLYASCCVDEFLFSGKERVTVGTDIDVNVADRGTGLHCKSASTNNLRLLVLWMDAFFHNSLTIMFVYTTLKKALQTAVPPRRRGESPATRIRRPAMT
jgi:hypothetical protein